LAKPGLPQHGSAVYNLPLRNEETMAHDRGKLAVYPGTFDPITNGHLDVIQRGAKLFDRLVIAVGQNPEKPPLLVQAERAEIIAQVVAEIPNVQVETFAGLTVDFVRKIGADVILRGIRNSSDLQFEFQVALTNRLVAGVETVFVMTSTQYAFTSSSLIRQMAIMGGDVSSMVPPQVLPHIQVFARKNGGPKAGDTGLRESP